MRCYKSFIVFAFLILSAFCQAQVGTVRFHLKLKGAYQFIKDKNVRLSVNDTLQKTLISDQKGYTGFLELPEGTFNVLLDVEGYRSVTKTIKIIRATGRTLKIRMKKS